MKANHIIARNLPDGFEDHFDVVIIGSGAGGGTSALKLAEAGLKVAIIEKGPYFDSSHFNMREDQAYLNLYKNIASGKTKDKNIQILQGRCVGGGTTVNWTASFRTPDQTLAYWQERFGLEQWQSDKLTPWFEAAEKHYSIAKWQGPHNPNNQHLKRGADKLGWHAEELARNVKNCAQLGYCGTGCPIDAKQSTLVASIPQALAKGATLVSEAEAWKIHTKNDSAQFLELRALKANRIDAQNKRIRLYAKQFILAGGAINSPGLMLRSEFPDPNNTIGKRTFLHPVVISAAIFDEPINAYRGVPQSMYSDEFLWKFGVHSRQHGFKIETPPVHPVLTATTIKSYGKTHYDLMQNFDHLQVQIALMRDGFHEDDQGGTVSLDQYQQPVLDYPVTSRLVESGFVALDAMAQMQYAAGARQVLPVHMHSTPQSNYEQFKKHLSGLSSSPGAFQLVSAHQMGGCGMGKDERDSVVDSNGRFHHLDNVFVFDGSAFPSSLGVNPQVSIYALAMRQCTKLLKTGLQRQTLA